MNCARAEELFSEYRDGALDVVLKADLEGHLACCPHCRQLIGAFDEIVQALADFPERDPLENLAERAALAAWRQAPPVPLRPVPRIPGWLRAVAAALALATTGTPLLLRMWPHSLPRPPVRFVTRALSMSVYITERKDRLVEDVRLLPAAVATAVEGRMDRMGGRVHDYRRFLERHRQGEAEGKQGVLGSTLPRIAGQFRTLASSAS